MSKIFKRIFSGKRYKKGEAYVDSIVKIIICVVVGALVMTSVYAVVKSGMNTAANKVEDMLSYSNNQAGGGGGGDTPIPGGEGSGEMSEEPSGPVLYPIVYNLTYCTSSNTTESIEENQPFSTVLSADSGYTFENVIISVFMGGIDITELVCNGQNIDIPNVSGNVVITASALPILPTPEVEVEDSTLKITEYTPSTTSCDIYVNGVYITTIPIIAGSTSTNVDLSTFDIPGGAHNVSVIAKGDGYGSSAPTPEEEFTAMPKKGEVIMMNLDGQIRPYRVFTINGTVAKVMALFEVGATYWRTTPDNTYSGSNFDSYLNTTWYNKLSAQAKSAILLTTINQDRWVWWDGGNPVYNGTKTNPYSEYKISLAQTQYKPNISRYIYAPSYQDFIDYLGATPSMTFTNTVITTENLEKAKYLWPSYSYYNIATRTAYGSLGTDVGVIGVGFGGHEVNDKFLAVPMFRIDLSKISFESYIPENYNYSLRIKLEDASVNITFTDGTTRTITNNDVFLNVESINSWSPYYDYDIGYTIYDENNEIVQTGSASSINFNLIKHGYTIHCWSFEDPYEPPPCFIEGTMITLADGSKKAVEDLTYDDLVLVWDFDNGCQTTANILWMAEPWTGIGYASTVWSNGSVFNIPLTRNDAPDTYYGDHRVFCVETGKFEYVLTTMQIGWHSVDENGNVITLVSKTFHVGEPKMAYNIISNYHMNVYTDSVLSSCRLSNMYRIDTDTMTYIKDGRTILPAENFDLPYEWYYGLRLGEQPMDINPDGSIYIGDDTVEEYVQRLIDSMIPRE